MNAPGEASAVADGQRQWAGAQVDLPSDASPQAIRCRVLQALEAVDFVPSPSASEAIDVLTGRPTQAKWFREHRQAELQEEVEAFCGRFFTLPPAERTRQWEALCGECEPFPQLRGRLRALSPGLEVECPRAADDESDIAELAGSVCGWFTRTSLQQMTLRQRKLTRIESDPARWESAARELAKQRPEIAGLDAEFIRTLAHWRKRNRLERWRERWRKFDQALEKQNPSWADGPELSLAAFLFVVVGVTVFKLLFYAQSQPPDPPRQHQTAELDPGPRSNGGAEP